LILSAAAVPTSAERPTPRQVDGYQIVHMYPHDSHAFAQGLIYVDGHLFESTGQNGRSSLRVVDL
jgi:glutaminyl-peptide cyclotransferase